MTISAPAPTAGADVRQRLECPDCRSLHTSEIALMWCCNIEEEQRRGIYRGID